MTSSAVSQKGLSFSGKIFFGTLCGTTFGLGAWQSQRYFEKEELMKQREIDLQSNPQQLTTVTKVSNNSLQRYKVSGTFNHNDEILVGPRGPPPGAMAADGPQSGRSGGGMSSSPQGYYVITPLDISTNNNGGISSTSTRRILVNRGWIPRHFVTPSNNKKQLSSSLSNESSSSFEWEKPSGTVQIVGIPTKTEQPKFLTPEHNLNQKPFQLFWFDGSTLGQIAKIPKDDQFVLLTQIKDDKKNTENKNNNNTQISFPVSSPVETIGEYKTTPLVHAGYAFTWFGLSGAGIYMTKKLITRR